ncbi:MAG: zf-TFIIB domain-containing protein [Acidimicrobiia bacterium]|nr:zf-TFIIB domain-containing protein [Acidimicrobiia bacterium]
MNCPLCIDQTLDITYHSGIEIDVCPRCRGIWLDRGELEKLAGSKPAAKAAKPAKQPSSKDVSGSDKKKSSKSKKKKKKSLGSRLGDVLEDVLDL